jgi:hypothetical protein
MIYHLHLHEYYGIIILRVSQTIAAQYCMQYCGEESPSSIGQGCWVTPSEGDFKESATEIYR